jgi:hydrogenase nickel incorporation protein HypA/HybF
MHELSLAENILNTLYEIKKNENVSVILQVNVKAGALLHVVPETLKFAFETIVKETEFKKTILNFEIDPIMIKCNNCNETSAAGKNNYSCPKCKSEDVNISGNKDFIITSIDAE